MVIPVKRYIALINACQARGIFIFFSSYAGGKALEGRDLPDFFCPPPRVAYRMAGAGVLKNLNN
jgi:hypothetical protein